VVPEVLYVGDDGDAAQKAIEDYPDKNAALTKLEVSQARVLRHFSEPEMIEAAGVKPKKK
jgi:hypothetical protein